ncbi:MAG: hypothetical protein LBV28_04940 [Puniceicoccales bacterium]|jgi:hypothetical protein|nr:hypothetical protein [Puniceicoccales bacterium]
MSSASASPRRNYWHSRARLLAWRINLGWWLTRFAPLAFGITLLALAPLLWLRSTDATTLPFWGAFGAVLLGAALVAAWQARRHHEKIPDAFARLDDILSLHNRLSAAHAGVGEWPPIPSSAIGAVFRWRPGRAGGLLLSSAALLVLAANIAIPAAAYQPPQPTEIPPPLNDVRTWTRQLREEKLVEPKALEALEEKTEALLKHPQGDWYKAGAMEAAEHLREQTAMTLQNLEKDLAAIENAVAQAAAFMDKLPEPLADALQKSLADALQGLDLSALPLQTLERDALRDLDMKALSKMTPEQLQAMRDALKKNLAALKRNGGTQGKKGTTGDGEPFNGELVPAFIFAQDKEDPLDRLLQLASPANHALVRGAFVALSKSEIERLQDVSFNRKIKAYTEEGVASGQAEGIVFLPSTSPTGGYSDPADTLVEDALATLIEDSATRTPATSQQRDALLQALRDNRVRLTPFDIKDQQGECKSCSGAAGQLRLAVNLAACKSANKGGKGGGPSAPLTFGNSSPNMKAKSRENLAANDREHDTLGDLQGIQTGKHKVDKDAYKGPTDGGALNGTGDGGDSAWVDNLTPEERTTLKAYFK